MSEERPAALVTARAGSEPRDGQCQRPERTVSWASDRDSSINCSEFTGRP